MVADQSAARTLGMESMIKDVKPLEADMQAPVAYVPPAFERHPLQLITLGGSPGLADSGDTGESSPFGTPKGSVNFDDDYSDDDEGNWGRGF